MFDPAMFNRRSATAAVFALLAAGAGCVRQSVPVDSRTTPRPALAERPGTKAPPPARVEQVYEARVDPVSGQPLPVPLAVMVENHPAARPQAGLGEASVVYEALAEGGITRFLAIYLTDNAPVVGPVRSARPYFVDLMEAFRPVYVHCGQSWEAEKLLAQRKVRQLNQLVHPRPFWRDARRRRPHNLYASTASLLREVEQLGLAAPATDWPLTADDVPPAGRRANHLRLGYRYGQRYQVGWDYEPDTRSYLRSINGEPHCDATTGEQLTARTVIVQQVATRRLGTRYKELALEVVGSGRCWFVRDGRWSAGRWTKTKPQSATEYVDPREEPLRVAPGAVWIQVVPQGAAPAFGLAAG